MPNMRKRKQVGKSWDRMLWGIRFVDLNPPEGDTGIIPLIGEAWCKDRARLLPIDAVLAQDIPSRALLFRTRKAAQAWCRKGARWALARPVGDLCRSWRWYPVRVRETVKEVR